MHTHRFSILVVEDEPNDQAFIQMAFKSFGFTGTIHFANNGADAIAYMMGEGPYADRALYPYPTFIMTDLKMPQVDGFSVLEHLKANPAWAVIPTVVLSASRAPDDIRTAYLLGASAYHLKPLSFDELGARLRTLYEYWMTCEVPEVDTSGQQLRTDSKGKLGERYPQPRASKQARVKH